MFAGIIGERKALKLEQYERQNCCNSKQNLISIKVNEKSLRIGSEFYKYVTFLSNRNYFHMVAADDPWHKAKQSLCAKIFASAKPVFH